jgi:hypothetical protein
MSCYHEDLIRRYFAMVDRREFDSFPQVFHAHIVYERPGYAPIEGLEAMMAFYHHERRIDCGTHTLTRVLVDGDTAVCWGTFAGALYDGTPVRQRFADTYRFADGRILHRVTYFYTPAI